MNLPHFTYIVIPGTIAVGIYLLISSFDPAEQRGGDDGDQPSLDYDAWSEGISTVLYDEQGQVSYTLEAETQLHRNDNSTELQRPLVRLYPDGGGRWNISANSGRIFVGTGILNTASDRIQLLGDVLVLNESEAGVATELHTDFLTIDTLTETAETDRDVILNSRAITQTATGMVANLLREEITFLSNVRGSYDPNVQ